MASYLVCTKSLFEAMLTFVIWTFSNKVQLFLYQMNQVVSQQMLMSAILSWPQRVNGLS